MNTNVRVAPPRWYWFVSALAVIWMLFGVFAWIGDLMTDEAALAELSEAQRQLYAARPQWIFGVYAVAIFSGLAGAIALLLRQRWAVAALGLSLLFVVVQFGHVFLVMDAIGVLGARAAVPFPLVIFAIGVAVLWLSVVARARRWI